ncbi:hypothetical protein B6I21_06775 [candidate division KSB1 bacterium 4572_119]|nr:MAG: hypothetical protein B6I21_06775 [candidate division KSB1 bacterium 4572_119]
MNSFSSSFEQYKILRKFDRLTKALIDSSSIIYMKKAGFLNLLSEHVSLFTIEEIAREVGEELSNINIIESDFNQNSNDNKLINCAITNRLCVISEDKKLLLKLEKEKLDYYNSLMILNLLLYRKKISLEQYYNYQTRLKVVSRYSDEVWRIGKFVFDFIIEFTLKSPKGLSP